MGGEYESYGYWYDNGPGSENFKREMHKPVKVVDLTNLVPEFDGGSKEKLKQAIKTITNEALAGADDIYRYKEGGMTYIRLGKVERHINEAIDLYWPIQEKEDTSDWMEAARKQTRDKLAGMKKAIMEKNDDQDIS
jgi:hypothetical protein